MGRLVRFGGLVAGCILLAGCSGPPMGGHSQYSPRVVEEGEPVPKGGGSHRAGRSSSDNPGYRAEGLASWYGRDFHGRLTANREIYDMHGISAAHPTMPLPSYARVSNLENGRSIIVRVNDRGPHIRGRIVDLSIGTAKALGFYSRGLARVQVEYVGRAPIEGSDDQMLMATLRNGSPAPAPSKVMLASAKPFLPDSAGRPKTIERASGGAAPTGADAPGSDATSSISASAKGASRSRPAAAAQPNIFAPQRTPATAFAPVGIEGGALGFISGRGLY